MRNINAGVQRNSIQPDDIKIGAELEFSCCVHKIKKRSGFTFVTLRTGRYIFKSVHNPKCCEKPLKGVFEGVYLNVKCFVREELRGENGMEITITDYEIISKPAEKYSIPVSDRIVDLSPEELAENRCLSFRNPMERIPARILGAVIEGFCDFMKENQFMRVRTPIISGITFEEEKDSFSFDYFGNKAYISGEGSIYCQECVAFYDRVYDVCKSVFAKKRNSPRLMSEYTSLHFEAAFISSASEIMEIETALIKFITEYVKKQCQHELNIWGVNVPEITSIPELSFDEAMDILKKTEIQYDLDPTDEKRICAWAKEKCGSDFVFVSGMPCEKRPVYDESGQSFVLLFKGIEIAGGGKRIHDYNALVEKLKVSGKDYKSFTDFHKYGMPTHGGAGLGAERYVMQLLGLNNIRQVSCFPRDIHQFNP